MRFLNHLPCFRKQNSVISFLLSYILSLYKEAGLGQPTQALAWVLSCPLGAQEVAELSGHLDKALAWPSAYSPS